MSLISPCYNGENYLPRFLGSLLEQDYDNVEFIFVDDGSTDLTREVFESYRPGLEAKGWTVEYVWQENQGASGALNNGLKRFTGEYLIWPDSDDILYPNHIRRKVEFMEEHKDIGIAYCPFDFVNENDLDSIFFVKRPLEHVDMFENLIDDGWMIWTLGTIIRSSAFLDVNPQRTIPVCRGGQNCQIQMPVVYKYPYGIIHESLAKYVVRHDSHSHSQHNFIRRQYDLAEVWLKSIEMLTCSRFEKTKLQLRVLRRHSRNIRTYFTEKYRNKFAPVLAWIQQIKNIRHPFEYILSVKNEGNHKVVRLFRIKVFSKRRKTKI